MYDKNKAFHDQIIAILNRDKIGDQKEAFCNQKIAMLKDKIVDVRVLRLPSANFPFPLEREVVYWYSV